MSTPIPTPRGTLRSRLVLWTVLTLLAALGVLGTAIAIRANPLDSDEARNGISKWQFIEKCQEELEKNVRAPFHVEFDSPRERAEGVTERPEGGWQWQGNITAIGNGQVGRAQFACQHDKATGKTEILGVQ